MSDADFDNFFVDFGLEKIKDIFVDNGFESVMALQEVSDEDMKEIGVKSMGMRRQFLGAVKKISMTKLNSKGWLHI